jgi:hypothetical protein
MSARLPSTASIRNHRSDVVFSKAFVEHGMVGDRANDIERIHIVLRMNLRPQRVGSKILVKLLKTLLSLSYLAVFGSLNHAPRAIINPPRPS